MKLKTYQIVYVYLDNNSQFSITENEQIIGFVEREEYIDRDHRIKKPCVVCIEYIGEKESQK